MLTPNQVCSTLGALKDFAQDEIRKLSERLYALRRFASTLELAGDLIQIPRLDLIVPLGALDIPALTQLSAACPEAFGGLSDALSLDALRSNLATSYAALDSALNEHPYKKLSELDAELNSLIDAATAKINLGVAPGISAWTCLEAICGAASDSATLHDVANKLSNPSALSAINAAQAAKAATVDAVQAKLRLITQTARG